MTTHGLIKRDLGAILSLRRLLSTTVRPVSLSKRNPSGCPSGLDVYRMEPCP